MVTRDAGFFAAVLMMVGAPGVSCGPDLRLEGDALDGAADTLSDFADREVRGEELEVLVETADNVDSMYVEADGDPEDGGGMDDTGAACPVWAIPLPTGDRGDGSPAHPFAGLQRALDGRGSCDTVMLRGSTTDRPFDAGVDILLADDEMLTIAGSPSAGGRAELDAHGVIGLFATGTGTLVLRRLAVRNGSAIAGGCLNAQVGTLWLDDTEWSDCRAEEAGGAVWAWAEDIRVSRSVFLRNAADGPGGAGWLDGPRGVARLLVEASRFEENAANRGGALLLQAENHESVVRGALFVGNGARLWGSALVGYVGELSHCRFEENGGNGDADAETSAVDAWGTSATYIRHNLFLGNWTPRGSPALQFTYGTVHNNLFVGNVSAHPRFVGGPSAAVTAWAGEVRNNTFVDNHTRLTAAHLNCNDPLGVCSSNLFVYGSGSSAVGTTYPEWIASAPLTFNAWWDVPEPVWGEGVAVGEGNLEADPLFDDPPGDFRLGSGSACIDAGDSDPLQADADGSRNDIGAYGGPDGEWTPLSYGEVP